MELTMPRIEVIEEQDNYGKFVVEPLERGYGVTLGNSLRRVMLSSIEGAAITSVKIDKVLHEFSTIPGLKEDTTELLLNLKDLCVRIEPGHEPDSPEEPVIIRVARSGRGRISGADVECPGGVAVVNPECHIATISDEDASLNMEMTVEIGKSYVLPDKQGRRDSQPIGVIPVGSAFGPIRKVNYTVEATRVGYKTDLERLVIEITTNGTMRPSEALCEAAHILGRYFRLFTEFGGIRGPLEEDEGTPLGISDGPQAPDARIEELDFSVRTYNCLKKDQILNIADLVRRTEADLMQIRNFGKKSLLEVREKLAAWGLSLKGGSTVTVDAEGADLIEASDLGTLDLDERSYSVVQKAGITTVDALCEKTRAEIEDLPGSGPEVVADVVAKLREKGLGLNEAADLGTLGLGERSYSVVLTAGITTVAALCEKTRAEIKDLPGSGPEVVDEVVAKLGEKGRGLNEAVDLNHAAGLGTLDLGERSHGVVLKAGITTVGALCKKTRAEIRGLPDSGPEVEDEVVAKLGEKGLRLSGDGVGKE
ncbi:MAG TPA: DNA-directed RNA polymerase subunit alpha [Chthonomonadales bacterium]|nr:DNA-directed RNA polymerase subunit alpha [Chthonomonadales bacterium]